MHQPTIWWFVPILSSPNLGVQYCSIPRTPPSSERLFTEPAAARASGFLRVGNSLERE